MITDNIITVFIQLHNKLSYDIIAIVTIVTISLVVHDYTLMQIDFKISASPVA